MRLSILSLLLCVSLFSCKQDSTTPSNKEVDKEVNNDPNPVETAFYKCITDDFATKGISISDYFKKLEDLAIKTGNLKNDSASSYYELFEKSARRSHFPLGNDRYFFAELVKIQYFPLNLLCSDKGLLPNTEIEKSKLYKFNKAVGREVQRTSQAVIQPNVANAIMETYKLEDFENEYIKLSVLSFIAYRSYIENPIYEGNR